MIFKQFNNHGPFFICIFSAQHLYHQRLMSMFLGAKRPCYVFRAVHNTAALVIQADQGLMSAHLRPECRRHICSKIHTLATVIIQAEYRRHHAAALSRLQGGRDFLLISNTSSFCTCTCAKACCEQQTTRFLLPAVGRWRYAVRHRDAPLLAIPGSQAASQNTGVPLSSLPASVAERCMAFRRQKAVPIPLADHASREQQPGGVPSAPAIRPGQCGRFALRGEDTGLLGVPRRQAVLRNEGLLLHPWLGLYRARHIMKIPYLIPLVCGENNRISRQIRRRREPRLGHQRRFQLGRQFLPPLSRPAQNAQAGCPA